ncbi:MAG TPA: IS3 family transposase [Solirubrobacteraceae bacterium]|nr:IS3 family transposase [Solirubrobacteraceae bacterium]
MIEALAGQGHSAKACCRMLGVALSGYFYWRTRPPSIRRLRQGQLDDLVADIHRASNGTYGKRRILAELRLGYGMTVNPKAVRAAMRRLGIQGLPAPKRRRRGPQTDGAAVSDLVARQFARDAPNQLWLTDITEYPTREGKLYCYAVLDAHSRRVVG